MNSHREDLLRGVCVKRLSSFVGGEFSFQKLGSVMVGFIRDLLLEANIAIWNVSFGLYTGIEVVPGQIHTLSFHLFCVHVLVMWSDWGWSLVEGANFYFR